MADERIEHILEPNAASLSQSLRDIGYSLETSIADLLDNSITAGAKNVWIDFEIYDESPYLVITDDGKGMDKGELLEAMRPGSASPRLRRARNDLGRFGLGLKTASFSQCTRLTVVSKKHGVLSSAQWDLDLIKNENRWVAHELTSEELSRINYLSRMADNGTSVVWENMDRLMENNSGTLSASEVYDKFDAVEKHLSLVFHRYLSGEISRRKLNIFINSNPVKAFDPFCTNNKATQILREEVVRIDGEEMHIQPYILPHHSKLTKSEYNFYKNRSDFLSNQGVYVYRNGRLMAWGDWFRLMPRGEATKLARVRIDFPNSLDEQWTIDIKKSRAHPPHQVKDRLRNIISRIADQSKQVHKQRGSKLFNPDAFPVWERFQKDGNIVYKINRNNPVLKSLMENVPEHDLALLEKILEMAEASIPVEAIYSDYSSQPGAFDDQSLQEKIDIKGKLLEYWNLMASTADWTREEVLETVINIKPFSSHREEVGKIIRELLEND